VNGAGKGSVMSARPGNETPQEDHRKPTGGSQTIGRLMEHLSSEIQKLTETTMTFRTKIAFVAWIGPFVLLSSVVLAFKGRFRLPVHDPLFIVAAIIVCGGHIALGYIGARMERRSMRRREPLPEAGPDLRALRKSRRSGSRLPQEPYLPADEVLGPVNRPVEGHGAVVFLGICDILRVCVSQVSTILIRFLSS